MLLEQSLAVVSVVVCKKRDNKTNIDQKHKIGGKNGMTQE
jgi:hypothetical protein